jgi:aryl-alcohol dehydrogenase-like predicted oxidoreductase
MEEEMEFSHLGRSGLLVSRLCLGTMNFGCETDETDSLAILNRAREEGINFVDTADIYGSRCGQAGLTETILGRWFAQDGLRRERTVLATKVYAGMGSWPNDNKLSALHIRKACDASLRRLQTDYIDLYQMHHVDRDTPWDEIWEAMELLRRQGKVLYVGSSNFAGWHIAKAQEAAARREFMGLVSEQSLYNLFAREVELDVIPAALDYGLALIPWSPLHGGLLGGMHRKESVANRRLQEGAGSHLAVQKTFRREEKRVAAYESICGEIGEEPATVALAWLLRQPGVTGPIVGPRTMEQFNASLRALEVHLDEATLSRLDEVFPGHKPAPEEYAW